MYRLITPKHTKCETCTFQRVGFVPPRLIDWSGYLNWLLNYNHNLLHQNFTSRPGCFLCQEESDAKLQRLDEFPFGH